MKIELAEARERASVIGGRYKHNQQLEELRNLQDRLSQERLAFQQEKDSFETEHKYKKESLKTMQVRLEHTATIFTAMHAMIFYINKKILFRSKSTRV